MSEHHEPGAALEHTQGRRWSPAESFAHLSDRLARLPAVMRGEPVDGPEGVDGEQSESWYDVVPRFPMARSGYDCAAVDEHVAALERELSELEQEVQQLQKRTPAHDQVMAEIQRVGEQTSRILLAAHDQARETNREAEEQAERRLAQANTRAEAITAEAHRKRQQIQEEVDHLSGERSRLLGDLEALAGTLSTVAREASEQAPSSAHTGAGQS